MTEEDSLVISDGRCRLVLHPPRRYNDKDVASGFEHRVEVVAGPLRGTVNASCYVNGFQWFHPQLVELYRTLRGGARLGGYDNLSLDLKGDGLGHVTGDVAIVADHDPRIKLSFEMTLDQTQLPDIISAAERLFLAKNP